MTSSNAVLHSPSPTLSVASVSTSGPLVLTHPFDEDHGCSLIPFPLSSFFFGETTPKKLLSPPYVFHAGSIACCCRIPKRFFEGPFFCIFLDSLWTPLVHLQPFLLHLILITGELLRVFNARLRHRHRMQGTGRPILHGTMRLSLQSYPSFGWGRSFFPQRGSRNVILFKILFERPS